MPGHIATIDDPKKFETFRRRNDKFGKGIDVLYGVREDGEARVQQIIFDSGKFSIRQARKWIDDSAYETLSFEADTKKVAASLDIPKSVEGVALAFRADDWTFDAVSGRRTVSGQPVQRFRKQIIKTGEFVNDKAGVSFKVTPRLLEHWADTYHQMSNNGVKVPIPNTHAGKTDPDMNRGYVTDMFVDGDSLVMTCDLIGEDAIKAASRCDVSIDSPHEFVDGEGNRYIRPIMNVALCTNPVIPGLGEFVPIAASLKESEMDWKTIAKALGIETKLTDANAEETIVKAFEGKATLVLSHVQKALGSETEVTVDGLPEQVKKMVESKTAEAVAKASGKRDVDPMMITLSRDVGEGKLTNLAAAGFVTPDTVKRLKERYLSDTALTCSLSDGKGTTELEAVIKILEGNDPLELKAERSRNQTHHKLDDPLDSGENIMLATCERRAQESAEADKRTLVASR